MDTEHPENSWYGVFEDLPRFLRDDQGCVWELDYYAVETAVKVPGPNGASVDVTGDYEHMETKAEPAPDEAEPSDGTVKITNRAVIVVTVEKSGSLRLLPAQARLCS